MQADTRPLTRIYRPRDLADRLGISTTTIWRMRRRGEFPEPMRISPGAVGWPHGVLEQWLADRETSPFPSSTAARARKGQGWE
jgi:prophage regulatory protein